MAKKAPSKKVVKMPEPEAKPEVPEKEPEYKVGKTVLEVKLHGKTVKLDETCAKTLAKLGLDAYLLRGIDGHGQLHTCVRRTTKKKLHGQAPELDALDQQLITLS